MRGSFAAFRRQVAKNIKVARRAAGVTQEQIIARGGFNARWYQDVEAGKSDVRLSTLYRIAKALGVGPARLLETQPTTRNASRR